MGTGRSVVEAGNPAERDSKGLRLTIVVILILVLAIVLWLNRGAF